MGCICSTVPIEKGKFSQLLGCHSVQPHHFQVLNLESYNVLSKE